MKKFWHKSLAEFSANKVFIFVAPHLQAGVEFEDARVAAPWDELGNLKNQWPHF